MARSTVMMPDEVAIKSMSTTQLQALAADAELNFMGNAVQGPNGPYYPNAIPEQILRTHLLTLRALFDGRQFNTPRSELIALAAIVDPTIPVGYAVKTEQIALSIALLYASEQP